MIEKIIVMAFYHPWVGGGHRTICLLEEEIRKNRTVLYIFENIAEVEEINTYELSKNKNLLLLQRDKSGKYTAININAKKFLSQNISDEEIISRFLPNYVRSHNPVESFIPFLKICKRIGVPHIYDQMDFFEGFTKLPWGRESEKWYIETSDECVTVGYWLQEYYLSTMNKKMHVIPNGVKKEFIQPNIQKNASKVTILYTGSFADWFDWDLLLFIVENRPKYNFLLVGGCSLLNHKTTIDEEFSAYNQKSHVQNIALKLASTPNVRFTGQLPHQNLFQIYKQSSVGIIPFIVNNITRPCSPLKCYEYIASFLPVVSTKLKEIEGFPLVKTSSNKIEFLKYLDEAVDTHFDKCVCDKIDKFLNENTWNAHSDRFDIVAELAIATAKKKDFQ